MQWHYLHYQLPCRLFGLQCFPQNMLLYALTVAWSVFLLFEV
jgi:hypothetical protein